MWDILIDDWNDLLSNQYNKIQLSDLVKRKYYIKLIKSKIRFHKELLHVVPRWKNYVNLKSNIKYLSRNRNSLIYLSEIKYLPEVRFVIIFMKNAITFVLRLKKTRFIVLESDLCHLKCNDTVLFFRNKAGRWGFLILIISNRHRIRFNEK